MADLPTLPECAAHVWVWFHDLSARRTCGMILNPITWPEIETWCRLRKIIPRQWELDAITGIDDVYRTEIVSKD